MCEKNSQCSQSLGTLKPGVRKSGCIFVELGFFSYLQIAPIHDIHIIKCVTPCQKDLYFSMEQ